MFEAHLVQRTREWKIYRGRNGSEEMEASGSGKIYLPPSFRNSLFKAYKRYKLYLLCRFEYKLN